jgi:predicted phage terminase large subunit-like protein
MEALATEYQNRIDARSSLAAFTQYTYPQYILEPAHQLICDALEAVVDGQLDQLMIFAPPQSGKSELVSRRLPPFFLAHNPDLSVVLASYSGDLASNMGGDARAVVESSEYRTLFPEIKINPQARRKDHWEIANHRGFMKTGGFLGPLTGKGGEIGIVDDPIANWRDAQSPTIRQNTFMWFKGTFIPRIRKNGAFILVMTRWHEDDLAGRVLKEAPQDWHVIRLPAIAETQQERDTYAEKVNLATGQPDPLGRAPGEPICPERTPLDFLEKTQRAVGSLVWDAEYQGRPSNPEGNLIKREWLERYVDQVPRNIQRVRYWDKAGSKDSGAFTAGVLLGHDSDSGITYVEDVRVGQWEAGERENEILRACGDDWRAYGSKGAVKYYIEQEPGSGGKESAENTVDRLTKAGYFVERDPPVGNKDARIVPFAGAAQNGYVRLLRADWNDPFIAELTAIPFGTYRDMGDGTAGAYNKLVGDAPEPPRTQTHTMYTRSDHDRKHPRSGRKPKRSIKRPVR